MDCTKYVVGVEWDTSCNSPALIQIDFDGNQVEKKTTAWFNNSPPWGQIKRCVLSADGVPTFGSNARGDGLTLDGSAGQVMVRIPKFYVKSEKVGNKRRWWISPYKLIGFELHPAFRQRGGTERAQIYVGAYTACLALKADGTKYLLSKSGEQPVTGGEIVEISFTNGSAAPVKGNVLIGAMSGISGTVVDYFLSSGSFQTGDASGKIYLKTVDERLNFDTGSVAFTIGQTVTGATSGSTGTIVAVIVTSGSWGSGNASGYLAIRAGNGRNFTSGENITDPLGGMAKASSDGSNKAPFQKPENLQRSGVTIATSASIGSALALTRQLTETYANNNGSSRWGCMNVWTLDAITLLYLIEYANWNSQSRTVGIGQGVVNKPWTRRWGGEDTGSADTNIGINGTGHAVGTDGLVHEVYRGLESLWGNAWQFVIGLDAVDAAYRILKRDGTGVPKCPMDAGNYESTLAAPITYDASLQPDGYSKNLLYEDLTKYLMIPNLAGGSSSTYLCDWISWHRSGQTNILLAGSYWFGGAYCGVGCRNLSYVVSFSYRDCAARLEFV